jgi:hypothetical protein
MLNWLLNNQSALGVPPLTAKTRKLWFSTGWKALLVETNGHPEHHPYMRKIGTHYGDHSKNTGAQAKVTNATREANIRGGIRKQLWQSFKSVTKNIPPE